MGYEGAGGAGKELMELAVCTPRAQAGAGGAGEAGEELMTND
ncbi:MULTISPECIES: hypothetical protein [unclassified Nostoc]|nr:MULTISPECIES: hypothetical protein [unclassified Nostoc]